MRRIKKFSFRYFQTKKTVRLQRNRRHTCKQCLSSFKAIATSASFSVVRARVPNVNFTERTIITRTVIFTFRYTTTDTSIYFLFVFVHHSKKPPF